MSKVAKYNNECFKWGYTGRKVIIKEDVEGGNIRIYSPNGNYAEMDMPDDQNLRIYFGTPQRTAGGICKSINSVVNLDDINTSTHTTLALGPSVNTGSSAVHVEKCGKIIHLQGWIVRDQATGAGWEAFRITNDIIPVYWNTVYVTFDSNFSNRCFINIRDNGDLSCEAQGPGSGSLTRITFEVTYIAK